MCGRYSLVATPDEVRELFEYLEQPNFPPRYNIAPTQPIAVVRQGRENREFALMRWGLIPSWVKDTQSFTLLINARSETADAKPSFRNAFKRRRCLIPASGFYEWQKTSDKQKQPYWLHPAKPGPIAFAGLWECWVGEDGSEIDTAAILTVEANETLTSIHHRMPVVIQKADFSRWLETPEQEAGDVKDLLAAAPEDYFQAVPVSTRVNAVRNDDEGLQDAVEVRAVVAEVEKPVGEGKAEPDDGQMSLL